MFNSFYFIFFYLAYFFILTFYTQVYTVYTHLKLIVFLFFNFPPNLRMFRYLYWKTRQKQKSKKVRKSFYAAFISYWLQLSTYTSACLSWDGISVTAISQTLTFHFRVKTHWSNCLHIDYCLFQPWYFLRTSMFSDNFTKCFQSKTHTQNPGWQ